MSLKWKSHFSNYQSKEYTGHRSKILSLEWNNEGSLLATASTDHTIRLWSTDTLLTNTSNPRPKAELSNHKASVERIAWCPINSQILASVSLDKTLKVWNINDGAILLDVILPSELINLSWRRDGKMIAVGGKDDILYLISIDTAVDSTVDWKGTIIKSLNKSDCELNEIVWSVNNDLLLARGNGSIEVYPEGDLNVPTIILNGHTSNCYSLQFSPNGDQLIAGGADALITLWDYRLRACYRTIARMEWPVRSVSWCDGEGELVVGAGEDTFIEISEVAGGEAICRINTTAPINAVSWNGRRGLMAYAGDHTDTRGRTSGTFFIFAPFS